MTQPISSVHMFRYGHRWSIYDMREQINEPLSKAKCKDLRAVPAAALCLQVSYCNGDVFRLLRLEAQWVSDCQHLALNCTNCADCTARRSMANAEAKGKESKTQGKKEESRGPRKGWLVHHGFGAIRERFEGSRSTRVGAAAATSSGKCACSEWKPRAAGSAKQWLASLGDSIERGR